MRTSLKTLTALATMLSSHAVLANHADDATTLPTVVVTGERGSITSASVDAQKRQLDQTAGSVGFVDSEDYQDRYASNLHDVLGNSPGVFVETRYGQELRLSIRGSGLARGYHTRGLLILQDGIPTNLADGSGDYYQIDPLALRYSEIYKGGNGLAYGASTLGGAINFVTPTAYTALAPASIRVEAGGYGNERVSGQASGVFGNADALVNATLSHSDGWRDHSRGDYGQFNGNVGYRISSNVETRFYGGVYIVNQLLPGSLTAQQLEDDPRQATSSAKSGDQARDTRTERIANRTSFKLDNGQIDLDSWFIHKSLNHPIFQVLDEHGNTYGFAPRYSGHFDLFGMRNELYSGLQFFGGRNHAQRYLNMGGSKGAQTLDSDQIARNYEAYFENRLFLSPTFALMTGAKFFRDERNYENHSSGKEDDKAYQGVNPKVGVLWLPKKDVQVFADIARSQDVPDFGDLNQTQPNNPGVVFVPLEAQKAWTLETGTRGKLDRLSWDFTVYYADLRHEMLQYSVNSDIPASTFNADRTYHRGMELGLSYEVLRDNFVAGDHIMLNQMWTLNDFAFRNDAQYGNNKIPGAPRNVLRTSIAYTQAGGFYFTPTLDWVPQGAWADDANTVRVKGYALLGLQTGMAWRNGISIFVDARNLADRRYVSDISTVTQAVPVAIPASPPNPAVPASSIYYPGDGRNVYAGLRYSF
ncbi:MAG: TonB-dependent receptor [Rhizobium sp.]|nr:MAG: TonB-dependent receptor [Rhizobium sp.]